MAIFSKAQKQFALQHSQSELQNKYKCSEEKLRSVSAIKSKNNKEKREKEKAFKQAMKEHQQCEYGLLFQQTDEYRKNRNINNEKRLKSQITLADGEKAYMTKMKSNY